MSTAASASQEHVIQPMTNDSIPFRGQRSSKSRGENKTASSGTIQIGIVFPNEQPEHRQTSTLSPFERIKLQTDKTTAHGHPLIMPTEYGKLGPVFDVIALYHNAVKRQVIVAYNVLEALQRFKYEVTLVETELFFKWFETFQDAVVTILSVEDEVVFPFLEENGVLIPDQINKECRQAATKQISETVQRISKNLSTILLMAAGESVAKISSIARSLLEQIVLYFETEQELLPNVIHAAKIPRDIEVQLRAKFMEALYQKEKAAVYIPFVTHWLSPRQLAAWKKANLGVLKSLRYDQWKRKFAASYQKKPVIILTRLTSSTSQGTPKGGRKASPTAYLGRKNHYNFR